MRSHRSLLQTAFLTHSCNSPEILPQQNMHVQKIDNDTENAKEHLPLPNQITSTCRQLRTESIPVLLKSIKLTCCEKDLSSLNKHLRRMYSDNIERAMLEEGFFGYHGRTTVESFPDLPALKLLEVECIKVMRLELLENTTDLTPEIEKTICEWQEDLIQRQTFYGAGKRYIFQRNNPERPFRVVLKAEATHRSIERDPDASPHNNSHTKYEEYKAVSHARSTYLRCA